MYFDTADLRLAEAGATLRRRVGGLDDGWHLKLAVTPGVRTELQRPLGRSVRTVPAPYRQLVMALTRGADLAPVARLRTARTVRPLYDVDGVVLAELSDDRVSAEEMGATAALASWREVEVELVDGDRTLLTALAPRLRKAGARRSAHASKLARVLGGRLRAREPVPPGPDGSAGAVIWAALRRKVDALRGYDPQVRQDTPDSVHKMRVATRTLRSLLAAYRPLFDRTVTEPIRDELKWLGALLGEARDAEVMEQRLLKLVDAEAPELVLGPVGARIRSTQRARYRDARTLALDELDGERYLALLESLEKLVAQPPLTPKAAKPAADVLPGRVRRAWRRLSRAVEVTHDPGLSEEDQARALHEARKAAKRARYAAEAVSGPSAESFAKSMKRIQSRLGDHQDSVVSRDLLRTLAVAATGAGENGFTYGLMYGAERQRAAVARDRFERAWVKANRSDRLRLVV
jgi:CHAD domain-containing protein